MKPVHRLAAACVLATAVVATASGSALASQTTHARGEPGSAGHAVFVQTDSPAGNDVVAYHRSADGTLTEVAAYPTGGLGGILAGSVVDHLASQGSLALDEPARLLVAVNAGSNSIAVFSVNGDALSLRQVLSSGGTFPVSVAIHGDLVYVLNAEDGGALEGYRIAPGGLVPLPGSDRALGLDPTASPQFTHTPGQVAFSPSGHQLIVTTKANGNDVDVFRVGAGGYLSAAPFVNSAPGTVPFAIAFDAAGHLIIAEAGPNQLASFILHASGDITQLAAAGAGQAATCWITADGPLLFASNAGSATVSAFAAGPGGSLTSLTQTSTDPGTVDSAVTSDGHFLYVQAGATGAVDEFAVSSDGALERLGSIIVPGAVGGEGIAAG
jgi:hypothetical protein